MCVCVTGEAFGFDCWKKVGRKTFLHSSHVLNIHHLMSVVMVMKKNKYQSKAHTRIDKADGMGNHEITVMQTTVHVLVCNVDLSVDVFQLIRRNQGNPRKKKNKINGFFIGADADRCDVFGIRSNSGTFCKT